MAKKALLIGVERYDDRRIDRLLAPMADVKQFAGLLESDIAGFEVRTCPNPALEEAQKEIARLFSNASPDDLLLLYFAGHGISYSNELYLALRSTDVDFPQASAISGSFVRDEMTNCASRRKVLILDCCYAGQFMPENLIARRSGVDENRRLIADRFEPTGTGTYVLAASLADQSAFEATDPATGRSYSLYTHSLLEGIRTGAAAPESDVITTAHLHNYVYNSLRAREGLSEPLFFSFGQGETLTICRNPAPPVDEALVAALKAEDPLTRRGAIETCMAEMRPDLTSPRAARRAALLRERIGDVPDHERDYELRDLIQKYLSEYDDANKTLPLIETENGNGTAEPIRVIASRDPTLLQRVIAADTADQLQLVMIDIDIALRQDPENRDALLAKQKATDKFAGFMGRPAASRPVPASRRWSIIEHPTNRFVGAFILTVTLLISYGGMLLAHLNQQQLLGKIDWSPKAAFDLLLLRDLPLEHRPDLSTDPVLLPEDKVGSLTKTEFRDLVCRLRGGNRGEARTELGRSGSAFFFPLLNWLGEPETIGCPDYSADDDDYRLDLGILVALDGILDAAGDDADALAREITGTDLGKLSQLSRHPDSTMRMWAERVLRRLLPAAAVPPAPTKSDNETSADTVYAETHLKPLTPSQFADTYKDVATTRLLSGVYLAHTVSPTAAQVLKSDDETVMQRLYRFQVEAAGFSDLGAHFYVSPTGHVIPGRNLNQMPAAINRLNGTPQRGPVFIELLLNGDEEDPTDEQKRALVTVLDVLRNSFGVDINRDIFQEAGFFRSMTHKTGPGSRITGADIARWYAEYTSRPDSVVSPASVDTTCDTTVFALGGSEKELQSLGTLKLDKEVAPLGDSLKMIFRADSGFIPDRHSCMAVTVCRQANLNLCETVETRFLRTDNSGLEFDLQTGAPYKQGTYRVLLDLIETDTAADLVPDSNGLVRPQTYQRYGGSLAFQLFSGEETGSGYVAIGKATPEVHSDVNFDIASSGEPAISGGSAPASGTILKARWPVNLRGNTQVTTGGENPVLSVIGEDACVIISGPPTILRGQYWAPVSLSSCN